MRRSPNGLFRVFLISLVLSACVPSMTKISAPAIQTSNPQGNRFGTTKIEAVGSSDIQGTFTAQDNGDGTTTLHIQLDHAEAFNPWGLYAIGSCEKGVQQKTRPA